MRVILCRAVLAGVAIFASHGSLISPATGSGSSILEPAAGALLGQYYGSGNVAQTTAKLGRTPPVHLTYYAWTDDWTGTVTKEDLAAGRIPLVNWEPHKIDFTKIVDGSLDATIVARANGSKALGKKFFLDFAAEMNGDEAWGGNDAPLYVAAYRHIHDLFVVAGATNVVWAWCPNVTDIHGGNKNTMDYYPGDAYVDWTGVDGYNWGTQERRLADLPAGFQGHLPASSSQEKADHDWRDVLRSGWWRQGQVDRRNRSHPPHQFPAHQMSGLVRHQQGSRLAHQLVSRIGSGVHPHGEGSLFQSVGIPGSWRAPSRLSYLLSSLKP